MASAKRIAAPRIPKYRLHKPTGLAVVRLSGRDIYLGKHGTPESHAEYRRVISEWLASGHTVTSSVDAPAMAAVESLTVNELVLHYLRFAKTYYVKNGQPTREFGNLKDAVKPLVLTHGHVAVTAFGPVALKAVRETMIAADLSRGVVNQRVNCIRRVFKWGVENQLVAPSVLHGLQAVAGLKCGRCNVRETKPVIPISEPLVDAVLKVAPSQIAAMIELQRLTGMRPGEVVLMRAIDLDTSGPIWVYTPREHKTEHHGRKRDVHLGPQAQAVLRRYLKKDLDAFIFSPQDVMQGRRSVARQERQTPLTPSQLARRPKSDQPPRFSPQSELV
jgi:integrase